MPSSDYGAIPSQNRPQKPVARAKLSVMAKVAPFLVLFAMVSLTIVSSRLEKGERRYGQVRSNDNLPDFRPWNSCWHM